MHSQNAHSYEFDSGTLTADPIPVLFCSDSNYCRYMAVAITSMLLNNAQHQFRLIIALLDDDGRAKRNLADLVARFPNATLEFKILDRAVMQSFRVDGHITLGSYIRLFMATFLDSEIDKLIYLDCDLLVCQDLSELWATELGHFLVGAVQDPYSDNHVSLGFKDDEKYFNAGVLLVNLRQWRKEALQGKLVDYIKTHSQILKYHDQDALNAVLKNRILRLPYKWNFAARNADVAPAFLGMSRGEYVKLREHPVIVHFTSYVKPWIAEYAPHYKELYMRYLALTPWREEMPVLSSRSSFCERRKRLTRQTITFLKWHFPQIGRLARRVYRLDHLDFDPRSNDRKGIFADGSRHIAGYKRCDR